MGFSTVIHWFRKGLRVHDNPALNTAAELVQEDPTSVLRPIFVLDPEIIKWLKVGPNRWRFLHQSLEQLDANLRTINSRLYVIRGNPKDVIKKLFENWKVTHITFESDIEPYAKERDLFVEQLSKQYKVKLIQSVSHTIYDPAVVIAKNHGKPPMQYQRFLSITESISAPDPVPAPRKLPSRSKPAPDKNEKENSQCYDCPTLSELKVKSNMLGENIYPGGENEGLARMRKHLKEVKWICSFEKPKTSPNSLEPSTTVLSPYLKFGCLSSRLLYKELNTLLKKHPKHTKPPISLVGQLMWREFYYAAASTEPNFHKMVGNSICRQIPWNRNPDLLAAWTHGQTGYPFIDAVMRQLRQEGWIHHLARHAVACFLTRGDLWISWEEGQKVFEELLLDADWALNAGNWMWLSASAFFYQYFRVYSPVAFGKKTDKDGQYIRKYVPELKSYPAAVIYEPWKATPREQAKYGCVLGTDYPHRIVIHEVVYKMNLTKMAAAYKKHNSGHLDEIEDNKQPVVSIKKAKKNESSPSASTSAVNELVPLSKKAKKEPKSP